MGSPSRSSSQRGQTPARSAAVTEAPVIIEVAINGVTTRQVNPLVPLSPDEIAADGIVCLEAGAAIIHIHNPDLMLPPPAAAALYAEALAPIRAACPAAVLYPTTGAGPSIHDRYAHNRSLARRGLADMAVIDPGSTNIASTNPDGELPVTAFVYANSPADIAYMMDVCRSEGLGPSLAIYEPGYLRAVIAYRRAGKLPGGSLTKFYFSEMGYGGVGYPFYSAPPIREALDMYCAMLREDALPWGVAVIGGGVMDTELARLALQRGGHLRIGLEDHFLGPSNLDQVAQAVELCRSVGRPVASPDEARAILGLRRT
jgi:uncharacterized protein (DUF849 family)